MVSDIELKVAIYSHIAETAKAPTVFDMASAVGMREKEVFDGYQRLAANRVLVLDSEWRDHPHGAPVSPVSQPSTECEWVTRSTMQTAPGTHSGYLLRLHCRRRDLLPLRAVETTPTHCGPRKTLPGALRDPFCGSGCSMVGRYRLYLTDHALLPVGRDGQ